MLTLPAPTRTRPALHVTAPGRLEAPAGSLITPHLWHLMYQYVPQAAPAGTSCWGHSCSPWGADSAATPHAPFTWTHWADALTPVAPEDTVLAGSVVSDGTHIHLYYTAVCRGMSSIHRAILTESGIHRCGKVVGNRRNYQDFRSPCVITDTSGWLMLALVGPITSPTPVALRSFDADSWDVLGPLRFHGSTGLEGFDQLVSPRIVLMRDTESGQLQHVLLLTVLAGDVEVCGYLVGTLTEATFTVRTPFTRIDYGHDFSRPRCTNSHPLEPLLGDTTVIFGYLPAAGPGWTGCLSIPREVRLSGGTLYQTPYSGLIEQVEDSLTAQVWTGLFDFGPPNPGEPSPSVRVSICGPDKQPRVHITHAGDHIRLRRFVSSDDADAQLDAIAPLPASDSRTLTVLADGPIVEVFADAGAAVLTSCIDTSTQDCHFSIRTCGDVTIESVLHE